MSIKKEKIVLTFKSSTDASAMDRMCKKSGIIGRIVPVPRSISASCGLCYICSTEQEEDMMKVIEEKKLTYEALYYREMY